MGFCKKIFMDVISVKFSVDVMSMDGQSTKRPINIAENFNRLSRVRERYRQMTDRQTDGRTSDII